MKYPFLLPDTVSDCIWHFSCCVSFLISCISKNQRKFVMFTALSVDCKELDHWTVDFWWKLSISHVPHMEWPLSSFQEKPSTSKLSHEEMYKVWFGFMLNEKPAMPNLKLNHKHYIQKCSNYPHDDYYMTAWSVGPSGAKA